MNSSFWQLDSYIQYIHWRQQNKLIYYRLLVFYLYDIYIYIYIS